MMYITNKVKLYPNKTQSKFFELNFEQCRRMYNKLLYFTNSIYLKYSRLKETDPNFEEKKFASENKIPNIGVIKKDDKDFEEADSSALCNEYSNMVNGMKLFYKGHSKKPKFKSKLKNKNSYTTSYTNRNIRLSENNKKLRLPKIGFVRVRGVRVFPKSFKIKCVTVFKDNRGYYYASIVYSYPDNLVYDRVTKTWIKEDEVKNIEDKTQNIIEEENKIENVSKNEEKIIGLDFKIDNIFVSSDNFTPKFPKKYFYLLNKIPILQKQLNKKKKGSKNYNKKLDELRKTHRKIVNIRNNFEHLISAKLAGKYTTVVIEDISIKEVAKQLGSGKNAYNTAFKKFVQKLGSKLNGNVIKVSKWFPSSKTCSNCGHVKKHLKLSQRIYRCSMCGCVIDRDFNAAINLRNEGLKILFGN